MQDVRYLAGHDQEARDLICALLGIETTEELQAQAITRVQLDMQVGVPVTVTVHRFATRDSMRTAGEITERYQLVPIGGNVTSIGDTHQTHVA